MAHFAYKILVAMKVLHMLVSDSGVNINKVLSCNIKTWPRFPYVNFLGFLMMKKKKKKHFQMTPSFHSPSLRRTGGQLQMNRMRNIPLKLETSGEVPIILEESIEYTSNE